MRRHISRNAADHLTIVMWPLKGDARYVSMFARAWAFGLPSAAAKHCRAPHDERLDTLFGVLAVENPIPDLWNAADSRFLAALDVFQCGSLVT